MNISHPLDTLADPTRRAMLEILCASPQAAGDLARLLDVSPSVASQHLKLLAQAGLVSASRTGKHRIYRCLPAALDRLQVYFAQLQTALADAAKPIPAGTSPPDLVDLAAAGYGRAWPGQDPHIYAIAIRLLLLAAQVQRGLADTAARLDLHGGELMVLDALLHRGPPYSSTPTQLQKNMPITLAGITKRIDRLQRQGLVQRLADPDDGRGTLICLTIKAESMLQGIMTQQQYGNDHIAIMRLDASSRALLSGQLKALLGLMQEVTRKQEQQQ